MIPIVRYPSCPICLSADTDPDDADDGRDEPGVLALLMRCQSCGHSWIGSIPTPEGYGAPVLSLHNPNYPENDPGPAVEA